jgi:hypothetical protein
MNWYKKAQQNIELWLDDERDPKDSKIQKQFGANGTEIWVKSVPEAIKYLSYGNVSYISFDNDLGTVEEGYDLATWIERKAYNKEIPKLSWNIHSQNPSASLRIEQAMKNADKYWDNIEKSS